MTPFDCELLRAGWPAQPINTVSAVAFLVAATWLWRRRARVPAAAVAAVGAGSAWFHSDPSGAASWAHDVALYALLALAAVYTWRLIAAQRPPLLAAAILASGLAIWFVSRTGGALCRPDYPVQGHAVWHVMAAIAAALVFSMSPNYETGESR